MSKCLGNNINGFYGILMNVVFQNGTAYVRVFLNAELSVLSSDEWNNLENYETALNVMQFHEILMRIIGFKTAAYLPSREVSSNLLQKS
jgi:hypothetical protein